MLGVILLLNRRWQVRDEIGNILPAHIHHQRAGRRQRVQQCLNDDIGAAHNLANGLDRSMNHDDLPGSHAERLQLIHQLALCYQAIIAIGHGVVFSG
jgi:hypothetical protein